MEEKQAKEDTTTADVEETKFDHVLLVTVLDGKIHVEPVATLAKDPEYNPTIEITHLVLRDAADGLNRRIIMNATLREWKKELLGGLQP